MAENNQGKDAKRKETSRGRISNVLRPRIREWKYSAHLFRKSALAMVGLIIVIAIFIIALLAPLLAPMPISNTTGKPISKDPMLIPLDFQQPKPPGAPSSKWNGTFTWGSGSLGADIYYGCMWGARTSIYIAMTVVLISLLIGIVVGAISGYFGGVIDEILMRITDIFLSIPGLILAMAVAAVLSSHTLETTLLALIIVWWPPYARLVRGQVLSLKESTYVEAAKALGAKRMRILFRHIIPNTMSPIIVNATMDLGVVVLVAAGLSFIGYGPPVGYAEWGKMVADGQNWLTGNVYYEGQGYNPWWIWAFPAFFIFLFVMGFNLLGDGLRDILDPRLRR
jgi:peptide/nickel transport system permease protein